MREKNGDLKTDINHFPSFMDFEYQSLTGKFINFIRENKYIRDFNKIKYMYFTNLYAFSRLQDKIMQ